MHKTEDQQLRELEQRCREEVIQMEQELTKHKQEQETQRKTLAEELRQKIKEWQARELERKQEFPKQAKAQREAQREKIIHYLEEVKNISDISLSYPFHFVLHISREPIMPEGLESIIEEIRQQTQNFEKELISLTQGMYNREKFKALAFVHALKYLNDNNKLTFPQPVFIQFLHLFYSEISEIPESDHITATYYQNKLTIRFSFESIVTHVFTLTID